jgi:pyruvate ferredoxin oxidoreductase gamma subunit
MFQVRFHGRGGQGVVTAAEILSLAAFAEDQYAQAFPSFGSERMGAPVMAFCRIDTRPIRLREPVMKPDCLIIQDATLLQQMGLFDGLSRDGYILLNSKRGLAESGLAKVLGKFQEDRCITVPATELALQFVKRPVPNAALLGAFAALTEVVKLESVISAIRDKFPGSIGEANATAARMAYESVRLVREATHATAN